MSRPKPVAAMSLGIYTPVLTAMLVQSVNHSINDSCLHRGQPSAEDRYLDSP